MDENVEGTRIDGVKEYALLKRVRVVSCRVVSCPVLPHRCSHL